MGSNLVYGFDKECTFRPKYMIRNTRSSQRYKRNNENSMSKGDTLLSKNK